ncbi:uncharacterized protein [Musca autumnalis]|uniref:uncharacterized protein n=1 Tax=Musca autumnalis TaxID=221902 RepID=UPI003CF45E1E
MASVPQAFVAGVEDAVMREADYNKASEKDGVCGEGIAVNGDGGSVNQVAMRDTLVGKRMLKENGGRDKLVKASNQKTMADGKQDAKKRRFNDEVVLYTPEYKEKLELSWIIYGLLSLSILNILLLLEISLFIPVTRSKAEIDFNACYTVDALSQPGVPIDECIWSTTAILDLNITWLSVS